jgi:hypothetical protein
MTPGLLRTIGLLLFVANLTFAAMNFALVLVGVEHWFDNALAGTGGSVIAALIAIRWPRAAPARDKGGAK